MHRRCSRCPDDSRLATPGFETWIFVVWAHHDFFHEKKIRWFSRWEERRESRQDTGLPTHWALSLLVWLIVVARVCVVLGAMPFISCLEFDWFGGNSTSIFDSYVMCWIPKRPRIAPPFTHTTLYTYMQRLVALRLMKYGRKVLRRWRPKNGVEHVMCWFFERQGRVFDNGITSWVSYQLCYRRRSFSLWHQFCMVLIIMQWKESVFFCRFETTLSFRNDTRRMYTS